MGGVVGIEKLLGELIGRLDPAHDDRRRLVPRAEQQLARLEARLEGTHAQPNRDFALLGGQ